MSAEIASFRKIPWFVPLFAAYPIVFLAGQNVGQVSGGTPWVLAVVAIAATLLTYGILRLRARSATGAGVAAVCVLVFFFAYPVAQAGIQEAVSHLGPKSRGILVTAGSTPTLRILLPAIWALMAVAAADRIARSAWATRPEVDKTFTFAAIALLVLASVPIAASASRALRGTADEGSEISVDGRAAAATGSPDVYYIVLDGYARADVLKREYGFDNSEFLDGLRQRGFQVADQSSANYGWTFLSLASTLNLGYLDDAFPSQMDPANRDRSVVNEGIRNNETARFLRRQGYEIVHVQSTYYATASNPHADREIKCEQQIYDDEFVRAVVEASWLGALRSKASVDLADCHRGNFRALGRMEKSPRPKFVFAHFIVPHHPYLFDRDGKVLRNATISNQFEAQKRLWEDKASYVSQLEYVNRLVTAALDGILASSSQPPVIVLASDHGPNLSNSLAGIQYAAVRLANFSAYFLPDAPADLMPQDGSAVNQFRRILSHYFGANLEPLPDRYFLSPYGRPFDMHEVPADALRRAWNDTSTAQATSAVAANREHN